jgi:hypothetical protein
MSRISINSSRAFLLCAAALFLLTAPRATASAETAPKLEVLKQAIDANPGLDAKAKAFVKEKLLPLCTNAVFQKETQAQNDKHVSLDAIKKIDADWQAAEEPLPVQTEKQSNACAAEIKKIDKESSVISEAFVMDNQGAVVGENHLTSDYWQGDEDKWTKSFNDGKGGVDAGKPSLDKSANVVLQQISLPIFAEDGKVIGAVTWGILVEKL